MSPAVCTFVIPGVAATAAAPVEVALGDGLAVPLWLTVGVGVAVVLIDVGVGVAVTLVGVGVGADPLGVAVGLGVEPTGLSSRLAIADAQCSAVVSV